MVFCSPVGSSQVARLIGVTEEQKRAMGVNTGLELIMLPHGSQLRQDLLERYGQHFSLLKQPGSFMSYCRILQASSDRTGCCRGHARLHGVIEPESSCPTQGHPASAGIALCCPGFVRLQRSHESPRDATGQSSDLTICIHRVSLALTLHITLAAIRVFLCRSSGWR